MLGGRGQAGTCARAGVDTPGAKGRVDAPAPTGRPKWSSVGADRWVSNHHRSIAFEVPGENVASSWMTSARPVLVVRCLLGTTQAFVYAGAPAIEQRDDRRTVRVSFDRASEAVERWPASADHDALFAPDGIAFARRLSGAHLRFGFLRTTDTGVDRLRRVHGFDAYLASLARTCRWKK